MSRPLPSPEDLLSCRVLTALNIWDNDRLEAIAKKQNRPKSYVMRLAFQQYLESLDSN